MQPMPRGEGRLQEEEATNSSQDGRDNALQDAKELVPLPRRHPLLLQGQCIHRVADFSNMVGGQGNGEGSCFQQPAEHLFPHAPRGIASPQLLGGVSLMPHGAIEGIIGAKNGVNGVKKVLPRLGAGGGIPLCQAYKVIDVNVDIKQKIATHSPWEEQRGAWQEPCRRRR